MAFDWDAFAESFGTGIQNTGNTLSAMVLQNYARGQEHKVWKKQQAIRAEQETALQKASFQHDKEMDELRDAMWNRHFAVTSQHDKEMARIEQANRKDLADYNAHLQFNIDNSYGSESMMALRTNLYQKGQAGDMESINTLNSIDALARKMKTQGPGAKMSPQEVEVLDKYFPQDVRTGLSSAFLEYQGQQLRNDYVLAMTERLREESEAFNKAKDPLFAIPIQIGNWEKDIADMYKQITEIQKDPAYMAFIQKAMQDVPDFRPDKAWDEQKEGVLEKLQKSFPGEFFIYNDRINAIGRLNGLIANTNERMRAASAMLRKFQIMEEYKDNPALLREILSDGRPFTPGKAKEVPVNLNELLRKPGEQKKETRTVTPAFGSAIGYPSSAKQPSSGPNFAEENVKGLEELITSGVHPPYQIADTYGVDVNKKNLGYVVKQGDDWHYLRKRYVGKYFYDTVNEELFQVTEDKNGEIRKKIIPQKVATRWSMAHKKKYTEPGLEDVLKSVVPYKK